MEDQVTFASEITEGQYIHTSSRTYQQVGITLHENKLAKLINKPELVNINIKLLPTSHEINASATESGYTIKSNYYAMPNEEEFIKVMQLLYNTTVTVLTTYM